jgi:hypothetical protein
LAHQEPSDFIHNALPVDARRFGFLFRPLTRHEVRRQCRFRGFTGEAVKSVADFRCHNAREQLLMFAQFVLAVDQEPVAARGEPEELIVG